MSFSRTLCLWLLMLSAAPPATAAQELEPRVYLASPVGTNIVVVAAATSRGDVVFDPTTPVEDVSARIGALVFGYYRSFDFFGRSATLGGMVPLLRGSAAGLLAGEPARVERFGQGDAQMRLTVNLAGSPAMDTPTFAKRGRHANLGASLLAVLPVGQYDSSRVVNLGTNRWAFKPEVGLSLPLGNRWLLDTYAGVWLFARNDAYAGGYRDQNPLVTTQFHLSYNLSLRAWAAFDATFYAGGASSVNGAEPLDRLNNTRLGATLSLPIARRHSLKIGFSTGAWVRVGSDFNTFNVTWTYVRGRGF